MADDRAAAPDADTAGWSRASAAAPALRWDPEILARQNAWAQLLEDQPEEYLSNAKLRPRDASFSLKDSLFSISKWATQDDVAMLGRIWFRSALLGECLFFPTSSTDLRLYSLRKTSLFRVIVDACIFIMLFTPLLLNHQCLYHDASVRTRVAADVIMLLCAGVQVLDVYIFVKTTNWTSIGWHAAPSIAMDYTTFWEMFRAVCCCALILNAICSLASAEVPRLTMALIPVLVVVRRDDFKQLLQGIFHSIRKIAKFFKLWVLFVFVWAFMGLCLFRRYTSDPNGDEVRYGSYFEALYTTMHCMLSRPTVLYRLKPIFPENNYSAFYFVFLTVIGDILLTTGIIAMGTRQFRDFSKEVFLTRFRYRRVALHALFCVYSRDRLDGRMSVNSWVALCQDLGSYYQTQNPNDAITLFSTEDVSAAGSIDEKNFVRLCAALSTRLLMFTKGFILPFQQRVQVLKALRKTSNGESYDSMDLFSSSTREVTEIYQRSLSVDAKASLVRETDGPQRRNSFNIVQHHVTVERIASRAASSDNMRTTSSVIVDTLMNPETLVGYAQDSWNRLERSLWSSPRFAAYNKALCQCCVDVLHYEIAVPMPEWIARSRWGVLAVKWLANVRHDVLVAPAGLSPTPHGQGVKPSGEAVTPVFFAVIDVFQQFRRLIVGLMLIQTSLLASSTVSSGVIAFTWLLLFCFLFEALVLVVASQTPKVEMRILILIDFASFVTLCALGSDAAHLPSMTLTVYILLQSLRLAKFLLNSDSLRVFHALIPVLLRVLVLYGLILYSFAVVGNITLCSSLSASDVEASSADDDSASWVNFENLLHFNTFLSSLYTVAISAILSNWSMVLDAALKSTNVAENVWIYVYFYSFRIFVVVLVLPLMMSCIIQTFIQQLNKRVIVKRRDRKKLGLEYFHITGKEIGNDTILSMWLPNDGKQPLASAAAETAGSAGVEPLERVYDVTQDAANSNLVKYDKLAKSVLLFPSKSSVISFQRQYSRTLRESIAMVGTPLGKPLSQLGRVGAESMRKSKDTITEPAPDLGGCTLPSRLSSMLANKTLVFRVVPASMIGEQCQFVFNLIHHKERYSLTSLPTLDYLMLSHCMRTLSPGGHLEVASMWLKDSLMGSQLHFPTTDSQLKSLRILESAGFRQFMLWVTVLQMMAVFLIVPRCLLSRSEDGHSAFPRKALNIFDLVCSFFYIVEVALHVHAIEGPQLSIIQHNHSLREHREQSENSSNRTTGSADSADDADADSTLPFTAKKRAPTMLDVLLQSWTGLRVVFTILIVVKAIIPLANRGADINDIRLVRGIFPIMLIARNENFLRIMKAILTSYRESKPVYKLVLMVILLFGFMGYWLFHRFPTDAARFGTLPRAFLTVLHCATAAPFSLFVLTPYYSDVSQASPLFFLVLSYVLEVLCVNLIVAAGSVHFQKYGDGALNVHLARRYDALLAIWLILRDRVDCVEGGERGRKLAGEPGRQGDGTMSVRQWVRFTQALPVDYYVSEEVAVLLLLYVLQQQQSTSEVVLRSCEGAAARQSFSPFVTELVGQSVGEASERDSQDGPDEQSFGDADDSMSINLDQFQSLVFLIMNGVRCRRSVLCSSRSLPVEGTAKDGDGEASGVGGHAVEMMERNPMHGATGHNLAAEGVAGTEAVFDIYYLKEGVKGEPKPPVKDAPVWALWSERCFAVADSAYANVKYVCVALLEARVLEKVPFLGMWSLFVHFLLLLQLSFFSSSTQSTLGWLRFGYFLEVLFWIEMLIHAVGLGWRRYMRDSVHVVRGLVNVGSLASMIALGQNTDRASSDNIYNTISTAFLLVVLFQCLRLGLVCVRVRGHGRYRIIIENTFRALFLLFLTLYVFTVFAQTAFCGVLDSDSYADPSSSDGFADDDAGSWDQFSQILNFNNYAQTIFTLFEVSVLGSWSMVMDATAQNTRYKGMTVVFFFGFRLFIVLMVLPLLLSFMIRSFIALNDRVSTLHKEKRLRRAARDEELRERRAQDEPQRANNMGEGKEHSASQRRAAQTCHRWYRYGASMEWLSFKPQRRERRLRLHSAFMDVWDTSMVWVTSKDKEDSERYMSDDRHDSDSDDDDPERESERAAERGYDDGRGEEGIKGGELGALGAKSVDKLCDAVGDEDVRADDGSDQKSSELLN